MQKVPDYKTDKKDSSWLCKFLLAGLFKLDYIPPKEQRGIRNLTRYHKKLLENTTSNKNRIIHILKDWNVKLSSVLSDTWRATTIQEVLWEACNSMVEKHQIYLLQTIWENNRQLENSGRFDCWNRHESASKKSGRTTQGSKQVKKTLIEAS